MDTSKKLLMYDETDKERECLVVRSTLSEMYSLHHANCYHVSKLKSIYPFPYFLPVSGHKVSMRAAKVRCSMRHQLRSAGADFSRSGHIGVGWMEGCPVDSWQWEKHWISTYINSTHCFAFSFSKVMMGLSLVVFFLFNSFFLSHFHYHHYQKRKV